MAVPTPDAGQEASLKAELTKVSRNLDNARVVRGAKTECGMILAGRSEKLQIDVAKHVFSGAKAVSDVDAKRIVEVIKANGFCKASS